MQITKSRELTEPRKAKKQKSNRTKQKALFQMIPSSRESKEPTFFIANLCNLGTSSNSLALVRRISALTATVDVILFSLEAVYAF